MPSGDETEIRDLIQAWARAVRDGDMAAILANHTDDMVMFDVPVPLQSKGMAAYRATWDLFFQYSKGGPGSFDIVELAVTAREEVAFAHGILSIVGTQLRLTVGLRKNDRWLIAHEHHSYPAELG